MATTYTWAGITTTWVNASGWTNATIPGGATDDSLVFDGLAISTSTFTTNFGARTIDRLAISNPNVTITFSGARTLNLTTFGTSGLNMSAGTFNLGATKPQALTMNTGIVSGGILTVGTKAAVSVLSSGTLTISATGSIAVTAGELNINTTGSTAAGLINVAGGGLVVSGGQLSGVSFNQSAGTFTESGGLITVSGTASFSGGATPAINLNGGTFQATGAISIAVSDVITIGGGTLDGSTGGITNSGTIIGSGTVKGIISGGGVTASAGRLDITSNQTAPSFNIATASGSILELDGTVSGGSVTFGSAASGVLAFGNITALANFTDTVSNLGVAASSISVIGDNFINVQGVTVGKIVVEGVGTNVFDGTANVFDIEDISSAIIGKITLASNPLAGIAVVFGADSSVGGGIGSGTDIFLAPACFAAGTLIETTQGQVPVEDLTAGDLVVTMQDGQPVPMPVKWMGVRTIDIAAHPHPHLVAPVRIRAGAFGDDLPRRDLVVSTAHAIYADGKLVPANLLINNMTILQELTTESVTYYHVELDRHSLILAEGLVSESYLDTGNRAIFSNAGLPMTLHPEFHVNAGQKIWQENACAPLAVDAETIAPIWHQLAARAEALGYVPPRFTTTLDADVYLEADGRRLRPVAVAHGRHTFMLPAGTGDIVLRSRTSAPADLDPLTGDWRPLGVAVRSMTLHDGDDRIVIPADHPALTQGWHTPEAGNGSIWRWTAGNATIPVKGIAVPTMLDIEIGSTATYILTRSDREAQRLAA